MGHKNDRLAGKRIGIFGKGGSGKTTTTILLARAMRAIGCEVCVVDADSTNVGIHGALGLERAPQDLIDRFGGMVFSGGAVTCPVDDPTPLPGAEITLDEMPASFCGRSEDGVVLLALGKMGKMGPGAGCDGPIAKVARDLRVRSSGREPVTLIDFKAGFEDSARGVITSLDWVVVVVDPTTASVQIATEMKQMVERLRAGIAPATRHLTQPDMVAQANEIYRNARTRGFSCILNKVASFDTERFLRRRLSAAGIDPIGVIYDLPGIARSWMTGGRLDADAESEALRSMALMLEREVIAHEEAARE